MDDLDSEINSEEDLDSVLGYEDSMDKEEVTMEAPEVVATSPEVAGGTITVLVTPADYGGTYPAPLAVKSFRRRKYFDFMYYHLPEWDWHPPPHTYTTPVFAISPHQQPVSSTALTTLTD